MPLFRILCCCLLHIAAASAAACPVVRIAYIDQARPPYYLGSGNEVAAPPGASVELLAEIAASAGCSATMSRLPYLRMRGAVAAGTIDAAPLSLDDRDSARMAYPLDRQGKVDASRAMRMHTVLYVRATDKIARDADPLRLLAGTRVGIVYGAVIKQPLTAAGALIDEGANNAARNLEKLRRGRIDVFALSLISPGDMDAEVAARYGGEIVRLDKPAHTMHLWLAFNKEYYAKHQLEVDSMWKWIGSKADGRFNELLRKYDKHAGATAGLR